MEKVILVRYGEIILKGLNRPMFEDRLIKNIKQSLYGLGKISVRRSQARIFIEPRQDDFDFENAVTRLVNVMGIISVSIVWKIKTDFEEIKKHSVEDGPQLYDKAEQTCNCKGSGEDERNIRSICGVQGRSKEGQ